MTLHVIEKSEFRLTGVGCLCENARVFILPKMCFPRHDA